MVRVAPWGAHYHLRLEPRHGHTRFSHIVENQCAWLLQGRLLLRACPRTGRAACVHTKLTFSYLDGGVITRTKHRFKKSVHVARKVPTKRSVYSDPLGTTAVKQTT